MNSKDNNKTVYISILVLKCKLFCSLIKFKVGSGPDLEFYQGPKGHIIEILDRGIKAVASGDKHCLNNLLDNATIVETKGLVVHVPLCTVGAPQCYRFQWHYVDTIIQLPRPCRMKLMMARGRSRSSYINLFD